MKWWTWLALGAGVLWWIKSRHGAAAQAAIMQPDGALTTPDLQDNPYAQYESTAAMIRKLAAELIGCESGSADDFAVDWVGSKITVTDLRNNRVFMQGDGIEAVLGKLNGLKQQILSWGNYVNSVSDRREVPPRPLPCGPWAGAPVMVYRPIV